jgi:hypothetical protein
MAMSKPRRHPVPHLEVFQGRGKKRFYYRIVAANHETTAQSQGYTRKSSATRAALRNHPGLAIVVL